MLWGHDENQLVTMNEDYRQAVVIDGKRNHSEIDRVVNDRLQDLGIISAFYADADIGILLFEFGEDFREDVQTSAFVRSDDNLPFGYSFGFGNGGEHRLARFECFLGEL